MLLSATRKLFRFLMVAVCGLLVITTAPLAANAADGAEAVLTKDVSKSVLEPGQEFKYQFFVGCSGPDDCADLVFTDTFPSDVEIDESSIPLSTATREVTWDAGADNQVPGSN